MSAFRYFLVFCMITTTTTNGLLSQNTDPYSPDKKNKLVDVSMWFGLSFTNFLGDGQSYIDTFNYYSGFDMHRAWRSFIMPLGVNVNLNATPWLAFKTGVVYAPKGMKYKEIYDYGEGNIYLDLILKVHYIEVPVLLEFSITTAEKKEKTHVFIDAGVAPAFRVGSKIVAKAYAKEDDGDTSDTEKESEDWPDVHKFDLAYVAGIGIKDKDMSLGLYYERGTKSVSTAGWNFINQSYTLIMGINF